MAGVGAAVDTTWKPKMQNCKSFLQVVRVKVFNHHLSAADNEHPYYSPSKSLTQLITPKAAASAITTAK